MSSTLKAQTYSLAIVASPAPDSRRCATPSDN